jgi:hypothetical protein
MANLWNGLRAYYKFDDAASNPTDQSRYSLGTLSNAGYDAAGKFGSGLRTSTAAGKMTAPASPYLRQFGNPSRVSVQAWVNLDKAFGSMWSAIGVNLVKCATLGVTGGGFFLGVIGDTSNAIMFRIHNLAGTPYSATYTESATSGWVHYVGVHEGSTVRLYRNGVSVATAVADGTMLHAPTAPLELGEGLEGVLDEVAVWGRALVAGDVTDLYNGGAGVQLGYGSAPTDTLFQSAKVPARSQDLSFIAPDVYQVITPAAAGLSLGALSATLVTANRPPLVPVSVTLDLVRPSLVIGGVPGPTSVYLGPAAALLALPAPTLVRGYKVLPLAQAALLAAHAPVVIARRGSTTTVRDLGLSTPPDPLPMDSVPAGVGMLAAAGIPAATSSILSPLALLDMPDETDWVDPEPSITSVTASVAHLMTMIGYAGPTNVPEVDVYWEVEIVAGEAYQIIDRHTGVELEDPSTFTDTFAIPEGLSLDGRRIRLCVSKPTLGLLWVSTWQGLYGDEYNNAAYRGDPLPPGPSIDSPFQLTHVGHAGPGVHKIPTRDFSGGAR